MGSVPGSMLKLLNDLLRMTTCAFLGRVRCVRK